jgi:hypothetical protein
VHRLGLQRSIITEVYSLRKSAIIRLAKVVIDQAPSTALCRAFQQTDRDKRCTSWSKLLVWRRGIYFYVLSNLTGSYAGNGDKAQLQQVISGGAGAVVVYTGQENESKHVDSFYFVSASTGAIEEVQISSDEFKHAPIAAPVGPPVNRMPY